MAAVLVLCTSNTEPHRKNQPCAWPHKAWASTISNTWEACRTMTSPAARLTPLSLCAEHSAYAQMMWELLNAAQPLTQAMLSAQQPHPPPNKAAYRGDC
eukprot:1858679-Amphidinium_carterae.1